MACQPRPGRQPVVCLGGLGLDLLLIPPWPCTGGMSRWRPPVLKRVWETAGAPRGWWQGRGGSVSLSPEVWVPVPSGLLGLRETSCPCAAGRATAGTALSCCSEPLVPLPPWPRPPPVTGAPGGLPWSVGAQCPAAECSSPPDEGFLVSQA